MTLEDHLGDIIGKARAMSNVAADSAAKAAGLSLAQLSVLEDSGQVGKKPDFAALARLIGLEAGKLEGIANGWLPTPKDLCLWRELRSVSTTVGGNTVNCYLVWDEVSREAASFDTGWEAQPVLESIKANQLKLLHIFITHSHQDHVAALNDILRAFPNALLHSDQKRASCEQGRGSGDFVPIGSLRVANRATPGHAADGVTYVVDNWLGGAPPVAIVGDAIFAGSIGRGFQSWDLARQKIREQIFTLPPATLICPGHGPLTTVAEEKAHNPFFE